MATLAGAIAVYMAFVHYRLRTEPGWESACAISETINCDAVVGSAYGEFAGVPLPVLGAWFYALLGATVGLEWLGARWRFPRSSALGMVVALGVVAPLSIVAGGWVMYWLGAVCLFCVAVYGLNIGMLAIAWREVQRQTGRVRAAWYQELGYWRSRLLAGLGAIAVPVAVLLGVVWVYQAYDGVSVICNAATPPGRADVAASPLSIVVYSDLQCAWCRRLDRQLRELRREVPGLRIRQRHYPFDPACNPHSKVGRHFGACLQARAVLCAEDQGAVHRVASMVFESGVSDPEELRQLAERARLDVKSFETCLSSERTKERLAESIRDAKAAGVDSTPTTFVNGTKHVGLWGNEDLACVVRAARR